METATYVRALRLDGGHVALDFVNTLGGGRDIPPEPQDEHLRSYEDLLGWSVRAGSLPPEAAERLAGLAARAPLDARRVVREALELRGLVYSVLRPVAEGTPPSPDALRRLEEREREALARARLEPDGSGFRWTWDLGGELRAPLWPLAHAAIELLERGPLERLKLCADCRWLFLDRSRNRSRRWCSMEECGTSAKKRRYVERRRARRARS